MVERYELPAFDRYKVHNKLEVTPQSPKRLPTTPNDKAEPPIKVLLKRLAGFSSLRLWGSLTDRGKLLDHIKAQDIASPLPRVLGLTKGRISFPISPISPNKALLGISAQSINPFLSPTGIYPISKTTQHPRL